MRSSRRIPGVEPLAAAVALAAGVLAAWHYQRLGLTLSHYDARGHLVVARRIFDSLTPGWQQVGAVWLPLPHLLNALPVQIDACFRTGASAVAISVASFALAAGALAWIVRRLTGSTLASLVGAAVFVANPNVLYLQATPMTEPLLLGLTVWGVALLIAWTDEEVETVAVAVVLGLACLTRYESWPVTAAALLAAVWARWRQGIPVVTAAAAVARVAAGPIVAILAFLVFSRATVGAWFIASGFFVPENKALGHPILAASEIFWGTHELSGNLTMAVAVAGLISLVARSVAVGRTAAALVALCLGGTAALPWSAFVKGHPFRIRYMVPLIAIEAVAAGVALAPAFCRVSSRWPRAAVALAAVAIIGLGWELRPFDSRAPMVLEAQWDRPNVPARRLVTECLRRDYRGETIMASMGSLGHYMQETAAAGFRLRDFVHEGNGDLWLAALEGPQPYVGWVLVEEKAEGGDVLAQRRHEDPHFLDGFIRTCDGAGVALYRREDRRAP